jgi:hypothetical protein
VPQEWMRQAKFCLAPYGHGWGIRLMKVIVAGCVPVIIQVGVVWPLLGMARACCLKPAAQHQLCRCHPTPLKPTGLPTLPANLQDHVYQPYEDIIPYADFSIRLPNSDLPRIRELLGGVTPEEWLHLHEGLKRWWRPFVWEQEAGGTAYQYAITSLKKRLSSLTAGFPMPT